MAKTKISEFDSNPANNTDIDGINLAEGMAPGLVNNAIRELMAQLKDLQAGLAGDNFTVGGNLVVTGTGTLGGRTIDAFPSGTKLLFQQTSAPTGWTKDTTHDNKAMRVVSGTAGSGGSVNFTTAFASKDVTGSVSISGTVANHTLSISQIPSHNHQLNHTGTGSENSIQQGGGSLPTTASNIISGAAGGGGAHNHGFSGSGTFTGTAINLAVQYVDVIIATKN